MDYLDQSFESAEQNIACDEALLELCEEDGAPEILRFWEAASPFVVLGYSNKIQTEVALSSCQKYGIPVIRRPSGGGTVLQAPGCLNYALVLKIPASGPLTRIAETNRYVLERHRNALAEITGAPIALSGTSDLTLGDRKFSGNAQRRKRRSLLYHGTFLLSFDAELMQRVLPLPSRRPAYRDNRTHADFLAPLPVKASALKTVLRRAWGAEKTRGRLPHERIAVLVREKYATQAWNNKF